MKRFIVGNWKMNKNIAESVEMVHQLRSFNCLPRESSNLEVALAPSFLAMAAVKEACQGTSVRLAAQNAYYRQTGAYCGEISPLMLKEVCEYIFVGHSERRLHFGDTDETVNLRLLACLEAGMRPIFCIGEKIEDYDAGNTQRVLELQLRAGLQGVGDVSSVVLLYEPVWALGTGKTLAGESANKVAAFMRSIIADLYGKPAAAGIRIVYAGSVNPDNALEYASQPMINGLALGTASLYPDRLAKIIKLVLSL